MLLISFANLCARQSALVEVEIYDDLVAQLEGGFIHSKLTYCSIRPSDVVGV